MAIAEVIAEKISERVKAYVIPANPDISEAIKVALEIEALPMLMDAGGVFALKPDGEIIAILWDKPQDLRVENDERVRNVVLFQGSKKYPELASLVPSRSSHARLCTACNGTGIAPVPPGVSSEHFVCYCGGLGWIP